MLGLRVNEHPASLQSRSGDVMTLGSHQKSVGKSQIHVSPKWLLDLLGPFDFDPCAADPRPWDCATVNITEREDGLSRDWRGLGRGYLNPPYDRYVVARWISRFADHNHGVALLHARTETDWFEVCWERASGILFLDDRITFCKPDGSEHPANSGAPAVLVSFGPADLECLRECGIAGRLITQWEHVGVQRKSVMTGDLFASRIHRLDDETTIDFIQRQMLVAADPGEPDYGKDGSAS
jgi:DNA N-6-adenine-methyltransferase Dam